MPAVIAKWNLLRVGVLFAILTAVTSCCNPASQREEALATEPEEDGAKKVGKVFHTSSVMASGTVEMKEGAGLTKESAPGVAPVAPPSSLQLLFINISAVQILWAYPEESGHLAVTFLVQISLEGQTYTNISSLISSLVFVYGQMMFGTYYQFRVSAYLEGVASVPAESDYFINGVTAPPGPPLGIRVVVVSPWELRVQWEVPATPTPPVYIVAWRTNVDGADNMKQVYQTTHVEVDNLLPASSVYLRVRTDISGRVSIWSHWLNVSMPPPYVPAPIIINHTRSVDWVWLDWQVPSDHHIFSYQVSLFTLCYYSSYDNITSDHSSSQPLTDSSCPLTLNSPCQCEDYPPSNYSGKVTDLSSNTPYHFVLLYETTIAGLSSLWSTEVVVITARGLMLECVSCTAVSATQLQLQWLVLGKQQVHAVRVEGCHGNDSVSHSNNSIYSEVTFNPPLPSSAGSVIVNDLQPWTSYSLGVLADDLPEWLQQTHNACCPVPSCTTMESAPTAPPSDVIVEDVSPRSVSLMLTLPPARMLNGRLVGFNVRVTCLEKKRGVNDKCPESDPSWLGGDKTSRCVNEEVFVQQNATADQAEVKVRGLLPAQSYQLQVAVVTRGGKGPYSLNISFQTREDAYVYPDCVELEANRTIPPSPSRLNISGHCVTTGLSLQWTSSLEYSSTLALCDDVWLSIQSENLFPTLCISTNSSWTYCTCLDPTPAFTGASVNLSFSILSDSILRSLFPANWNGILWVWLDLKAELVNGSVVHVSSRRLNVGDKVSCQPSTDPGTDVHNRLSDLAIILPIAAVMLMATLACITFGTCYIYIHRKRNSRRRVSEISMSQHHQSPLAIWNNYVPLRTADGRSSSSSSEQSLATISTGMTCDTATTITSEYSYNHDLSSISSSTSSIDKLALSASQFDSQLETDEYSHHVLVDVCDGRCSPEGCSVSSDDRDTSID